MRRSAFMLALLLVCMGQTTLAAPPSSQSSPRSETERIGTLQVQRHGERGRPVILIPGLGGGPWVWQQTLAHLQGEHVVYTVTLAGFDGTPAPEGDHYLDQADDSLLKWIREDHIEKPVLVGHSLGGTLALRFAGEHPELIAGVVAVDGLPIFPGLERVDEAQRQTIAARMAQPLSQASPQEFAARQLDFMRKMGVIDPARAERYAPYNTRSDAKAMAKYLQEDASADYRPGLARANIPILEISPYNAPDFAAGPMAMSEARKTGYYQGLLAGAPHAKVVSISPARHFVMLDQPEKFQQTLDDFLHSL